MSLENQILADIQELLREHGVTARWNDTDLLVLASRIDRSQQIDIGGFVDAPDLAVRVPRMVFHGNSPKTGDRFIVDGSDYRISQVSGHSRSPLITLSLTTTDE